MRLLILAAAGLALGGCATITRGTDDTWTVNTTPSGAAVKTSAHFFCDTTPCTFKLSRKSDFDVTITKTGYRDWKGHVRHHVSEAGGAGFVGNALIGGVFGAGLDIATGATLDLEPNPLNVTLEKVEAAALPVEAAPATPAAETPTQPSAEEHAER